MQKSKSSKSLTIGPKPEGCIDHNHLPAQHAPPHVPMYTMWLYCTLSLMHRKRSSSGPKSFASSFPLIAWFLKTFKSISDMVRPWEKPVMKKMSVVWSSRKCSSSLAGGSPNLGGVFPWRRNVDFLAVVASFTFWGVEGVLKMILSHRAPSSLNMSSYRAIWTHFRPNFRFVGRKNLRS